MSKHLLTNRFVDYGIEVAEADRLASLAVSTGKTEKEWLENSNTCDLISQIQSYSLSENSDLGNFEAFLDYLKEIADSVGVNIIKESSIAISIDNRVALKGMSEYFPEYWVRIPASSKKEGLMTFLVVDPKNKDVFTGDCNYVSGDIEFVGTQYKKWEVLFIKGYGVRFVWGWRFS